MKITTQLQATVVGILILGVGSVATAFFTTTGKEGTVVNQAGLVRGASQRLVKLELKGQPSDDLIKNIDKIINGLINGDQELELPPATNQEFIAQMRQVESRWKALKGTIGQSRKDQRLQNDLFTQSEDFFKVANDAVSKAEAISKEKTQSLRTTQIIIFAINVLILIAVSLLVRNITSTLQGFVGTIGTTSNQIGESVAQQASAVNEQAASGP